MNFLLIDATDRSKISSDQRRFFIALSLYPLSFFANTPFNVDALWFKIFGLSLNVTFFIFGGATAKDSASTSKIYIFLITFTRGFRNVSISILWKLF